MISSFCNVGLRCEGCFERGIFLKAQIVFEGHIEDFDLEHWEGAFASMTG